MINQCDKLSYGCDTYVNDKLSYGCEVSGPYKATDIIKEYI